MNKKDYLILTKGRAVCLALDSAIGLLNEMELDVSSAETARQECVTELLHYHASRFVLLWEGGVGWSV